jgi:hypothetical protein
MIPLDGSIPAALLIWFQTIASANPIRARMTVLELVFGCMLTGRGHVTQALSAITPRRGWRAYFRMLETDGFSWLDIVHALCRIVRDSFVPQDQCVIALDDTLLPPSSKKAPGAGRRFDHARKPNRPSHVLAQNLVSLAVVVGPPGRRRSLPLASRLADDSLAGGKLTTAKILIGAVLRRLRPDILLVDAWFMRARLVLWAVARGITVVGQARLDTVLFLRPRRSPGEDGRRRTARGSIATSSPSCRSSSSASVSTAMCRSASAALSSGLASSKVWRVARFGSPCAQRGAGPRTGCCWRPIRL